MITSRDNDKLKQIRKLHAKRERDRTGLFIAEGEDLVDAGVAAGAEPEWILVAEEGRYKSPLTPFVTEPDLLNAVSTLGSGTRVIGVFQQVWSEPGGDVSVYLHGVADPGNVGTIIRSAHAFADGPVVLGPGCADPYSPKAVRASMGSVFARPPARASFGDLTGTRVAFEAGGSPEYEADGPVVLCFGSERGGLEGLDAEVKAGIPMLEGPESLNVAMAATVALYDRFRMARHG